MFQLIYISKPTRLIDSSDLIQLSKQAALNNAKQSITGYLVFNDEYFMQYLEGEEVAVKNLYEKIAKDERHESLKLIYTGQAQTRVFPKWSMGFKDLSFWKNMKINTLDHDFESLENLSDDINHQMIKSILHQFSK